MIEKHDRIISDLMHALEVINREARVRDVSLAYIAGAAEQAIKMCNAARVPNADGYLVVATVVATTEDRW